MFEKNELQQITVRLNQKELDRLKALIALTKEVTGASMNLNEAINDIFIDAMRGDEVSAEFKKLKEGKQNEKK